MVGINKMETDTATEAKGIEGKNPEKNWPARDYSEKENRIQIGNLSTTHGGNVWATPFATIHLFCINMLQHIGSFKAMIFLQFVFHQNG